MPELNEIKKVVDKIGSVDEIREHICFFGGSMPYIYYGEESGRDHSDIDVLVDLEYMDVIRNALKSSGRYKEEYDSLNLGLDTDYGLKAWIDGIYVEFEPKIVKDGVLKRYDFSPEKKLAGVEEIPFDNIEDLIIPLNIGDKTTYCQSMELIKVGKEKCKRDKDLKDIEFIDRHNIDTLKYERVKTAVEKTKTNMFSYDKKQELDSMLSENKEEDNQDSKRI